MMKKWIGLTLAAVLCFGMLQGCGKPDAVETTGTAAAETTAAPETTQAPTLPPETTQPQRIHFRFDEVTLNDSQDPTCKIYNGTVATEEVVFGSEDESVATFKNGIAVKTGAGTTTVFAEFGGERLECTVTCEEAPVAGVLEPDYTKLSADGTTVLAPPEVENVDSRFFDDAVFVGDSVSVMLSYYAADSDVLGKAQFLVKESYSMANAATDNMYLPCNGQDMLIDDAVAATGAKKLFIMLGTNDMVYMPIEDTIENWKDVIGRIRAKSPDIRIFIESVTPIYTSGQEGQLTNDRVDSLNINLRKLAKELDCEFVNFSPYMKDASNGLADPYCSDNYVHLTYTGTEVWVKALKALITG